MYYSDDFENFATIAFPDTAFNQLKRTKFPNVNFVVDTDPEWYDGGSSQGAYYIPMHDDPYIEDDSYIELGGNFKGVKINYLYGRAETSHTDQRHAINGVYGTSEYIFEMDYNYVEVEVDTIEHANKIYEILKNMGYNFIELADAGYDIDEEADENNLSDEEKYDRVCSFILYELDNLDNYGIPELRELEKELTDRSNAYIDALDEWANTLNDDINSANEEEYYDEDY